MKIEPFHFARMVIEPQAAARGKGNIHQNVILGHLDRAVLHILGMDELPLFHDAYFFEQDRGNQTIEIGPR
jgi:hypothetical protein